MAIGKTEDFEISGVVPNLVPSIDQTRFNDLEIVGGVPTALNVTGIGDIVVYNDLNSSSEQHVVGIETVYKLEGGKLSLPVLHGVKTKNLTIIRVPKHERIIAAFVGTKPGGGDIRALRFTTTNLQTGNVQTRGYIPNPAQDLTYSAAFGGIIAFQGIKSKGVQGSLVSLGVQTRYVGSL